MALEVDAVREDAADLVDTAPEADTGREALAGIDPAASAGTVQVLGDPGLDPSDLSDPFESTPEDGFSVLATAADAADACFRSFL